MDCSPPGSSVHGMSQARMLECHFLLQGIFLTQGSDPRPLHWQAGALLLNHQGSSSPSPLVGLRFKVVLNWVLHWSLILWVFYFECKMTQWWECGFWYQQDLGLNLTFSIDHSVTEDKRKHLSESHFVIFCNHFYSLLIKKKVKNNPLFDPNSIPKRWRGRQLCSSFWWEHPRV